MDNQERELQKLMESLALKNKLLKEENKKLENKKKSYTKDLKQYSTEDISNVESNRDIDLKYDRTYKENSTIRSPKSYENYNMDSGYEVDRSLNSLEHKELNEGVNSYNFEDFSEVFDETSIDKNTNNKINNFLTNKEGTEEYVNYNKETNNINKASTSMVGNHHKMGEIKDQDNNMLKNSDDYIFNNGSITGNLNIQQKMMNSKEKTYSNLKNMMDEVQKDSTLINNLENKKNNVKDTEDYEQTIDNKTEQNPQKKANSKDTIFDVVLVILVVFFILLQLYFILK